MQIRRLIQGAGTPRFRVHGLSPQLITWLITVTGSLITNSMLYSSLMSKNAKFSIKADKVIDHINKKNPEILIGTFPHTQEYDGASAYFVDLSPGRPNVDMLKEYFDDPEFCKENDIDPQRLTKEMDWWAKALKEGRPLIMYGKTNPAPIVAHEYGHFLFEKSEKGYIQDNTDSGIHNGTFRSFIASVLGFAGWIGVAASPIIDAALNYPEFYSEFQASYRGIQVLKNLGASESDITESKKLLGKAYGTYITANLGSTLMMSGLGRGLRAIFDNDK